MPTNRTVVLQVPWYFKLVLSKFQRAPSSFLYRSFFRRYDMAMVTGYSRYLIILFHSWKTEIWKRNSKAQSKIEELHKEKDALQTRINAVGIKKRLTPSKRGRNT